MIRAWRDLPGLRDPDRFDAWLHRLIVNACLDLVRRRRRRVIEVELTPARSARVARHGRRPRRPRSSSTTPSARLEPGHRAVVALHYLLGMPLPDVAASLRHPARHRQVPAALRARRDAPSVTGDAEPGPEAVAGGQLA